MDPTYENCKNQLTELIKKAEYLKYTMNSLLYWDKITYMPPEGIEYRSKVMGFLGEELYGLMAGEPMKQLLDYFAGNEQNDEITEAMVRKLSRNAMYVARLPQADYTDYIQLIANAEQVWERAREENNFLLIQPYLERLLVHYRKFADCWGGAADPYGAWLGYYEEGFDREQLERLIGEVKPAVIQLLAAIRKAEGAKGADGDRGPSPQESIFESLPSVDQKVQLELTQKLLRTAGFSFRKGRVDVGAHPTILPSSPSDVRLVTSFSEKDIRRGIFSGVYLAGKGLYEQQIDSGLLGTMLAEVASFALAEGVGKLYENRLGRSQAFWDYFTPELQALIPELGGTGSDRLFQDANQIHLTPVRLEADELTFTLHVIIRCELEQELMDGTLSVSQLPEAWNGKYRDYLGIEPENSGRGVLQDIHWVAGYFGYFGSYLLADVMAAQLGHCIERDSCGFAEAGAEERFSMYRDWLTKNIFRFGGIYSSAELMEKACGEPLKADYFVAYLKNRFSEAYQLNK